MKMKMKKRKRKRKVRKRKKMLHNKFVIAIVIVVEKGLWEHMIEGFVKMRQMRQMIHC